MYPSVPSARGKPRWETPQRGGKELQRHLFPVLCILKTHSLSQPWMGKGCTAVSESDIASGSDPARACPAGQQHPIPHQSHPWRDRNIAASSSLLSPWGFAWISLDQSQLFSLLLYREAMETLCPLSQSLPRPCAYEARADDMEEQGLTGSPRFLPLYIPTPSAPLCTHFVLLGRFPESWVVWQRSPEERKGEPRPGSFNRTIKEKKPHLLCDHTERVFLTLWRR